MHSDLRWTILIQIFTPLYGVGLPSHRRETDSYIHLSFISTGKIFLNKINYDYADADAHSFAKIMHLCICMHKYTQNHTKNFSPKGLISKL